MLARFDMHELPLSGLGILHRQNIHFLEIKFQFFAANVPRSLKRPNQFQIRLHFIFINRLKLFIRLKCWGIILSSLSHQFSSFYPSENSEYSHPYQLYVLWLSQVRFNIFCQKSRVETHGPLLVRLSPQNPQSIDPLFSSSAGLSTSLGTRGDI